MLCPRIAAEALTMIAVLHLRLGQSVRFSFRNVGMHLLAGSEALRTHTDNESFSTTNLVLGALPSIFAHGQEAEPSFP